MGLTMGLVCESDAIEIRVHPVMLRDGSLYRGLQGWLRAAHEHCG